MGERRISEELAFQEPKKVFINMVLIPSIRECEEAIFRGSGVQAIRLIRSMIVCLDQKTKEDLD